MVTRPLSFGVLRTSPPSISDFQKVLLERCLYTCSVTCRPNLLLVSILGTLDVGSFLTFNRWECSVFPSASAVLFTRFFFCSAQISV